MPLARFAAVDPDTVKIGMMAAWLEWYGGLSATDDDELERVTRTRQLRLGD